MPDIDYIGWFEKIFLWVFIPFCIWCFYLKSKRIAEQKERKKLNPNEITENW